MTVMRKPRLEIGDVKYKFSVLLGRVNAYELCYADNCFSNRIVVGLLVKKTSF